MMDQEKEGKKEKKERTKQGFEQARSKNERMDLVWI